MKISIILAFAASANAVVHRHIKRDADNQNVAVIYDEDVTYLIKKGPQTTVTEAVGTHSTYYTTTYGAEASSSIVESSSSSSSSSAFPTLNVNKQVKTSTLAPVAFSSSSTLSSTASPSTTSSVFSEETTFTQVSSFSSSTLQQTSSASSTAQPSSSSPAAQPSSSSSTAPTPSGSSGSGSQFGSFDKDILAEHNAKRSLHGVDSLSWNSTLAEYAQNYADKYSCPSNGQLTHSGGPYGENLASGFSSASETVDGWYNEIKSYSFSNPGFGESTGHFSQVVWASTTQLGCAYKKCDTSYGYYVICSYYPAGNVMGVNWSKEVPALH